MDRPVSLDRLRLITGGLTILVAVLHLGHPTAGFPRLVQLVQIGHPFLEPRPLAFTLSGVVLIIGVLARWNGFIGTREAYLGCMAMMVTYLGGYVLWHMTGHGAFWPYHPADPVFHLGNPIRIMYIHLAQDPYELLAKTTEAVTLVLGGYLYTVEVRTGGS